MHMADALVSPLVGGGAWLLSGTAIAACSRRLRKAGPQEAAPRMAVLAAFTFAAQMVNVALPGTGASGHLCGGLLLAVLLGSEAAFLAMASVLTVQALFFGDGGLLALGCNVLNLALIPAFIVWPLLYRPIAGERTRGPRFWSAAVLGGVFAMELGAMAVVGETTLSGVSSLPAAPFALALLPMHLAIGLLEGLATAAVLAFVTAARPAAARPTALPRRTLWVLGAAAVVVGLLGAVAASEAPDGLEWSLERASAHALPMAGSTSLSAGLLGGTVTLALLGLAALGFTLARRRG